MARFEELGFYTLAGAPASTRDLDRRGPRRRGHGPRARVHLRAVQREGGGHAVGRGRRGQRADRHRHRGHQPQHPPPDGARGVRAARCTASPAAASRSASAGASTGCSTPWASRTSRPRRWRTSPGIMRRLWAGEMILGHDGPAGTWPYLNLDGIERLDDPARARRVRAELARARRPRLRPGRAAHLLHRRDHRARACARSRRRRSRPAAIPTRVKVWSCFATVGDHIAPDLRLKKTVGRLATYLQGYGDLLVRTNGWDPAVLERFRADDLVANFQGAIDGVATTEQLEHIATLIPDEWLAPMAAGSPEQCVAAVRNQLALGLRRRDPPRRDPHRAGAGGRRLRRVRGSAVDVEHPARQRAGELAVLLHGHAVDDGGAVATLGPAEPLGPVRAGRRRTRRRPSAARRARTRRGRRRCPRSSTPRSRNPNASACRPVSSWIACSSVRSPRSRTWRVRSRVVSPDAHSICTWAPASDELMSTLSSSSPRATSSSSAFATPTATMPGAQSLASTKSANTSDG